MLTNIVDFIWPLGFVLLILAILGVAVWRGAQEERKENREVLKQFADLFESVPEQDVLESVRIPDGGASGSLKSEFGSAAVVVLEAPNGLYVRFAWNATYFLIPWSGVEDVSLLDEKKLILHVIQKSRESATIQMPWAPKMKLDGWHDHNSASD